MPDEKGINESFLQLLRAKLDTAGMTTVGIHGFDNWNYASGAASPWNWVLDLPQNPALAASVYAIGEHTTWGTEGAPPAEIVAAAKAAGKPIWDTEEHIYEKGFQCEIDIARAYLQNYIQSRITKTIYWYLITSFYPMEAFYDVTMALASTPWSGAYTINPALWGYAHMTQFARPGWQFLDHASGTLAGGGDYVTLLSPNKTDFSIVADTSGAAAPQDVTFALADGLAATLVSVWRSDNVAQFQQLDAVPVVDGSFTISMEQNAIYSVTTTSGQTKGDAPAPPAADAFPFPYYENYDHYGDFIAVGYRPYYHADIAATFELAERPDGAGQCLHQVVGVPAQSWAPEPSGPYTILGDKTWQNYEVSVDASIDTSGWASVMGRISGVGTGYGTGFKGYYLTLDPTGAWGFYAGTGADTANSTETSNTLASGQTTLAAGAWHKMKLVFSGSSIAGSIDGRPMFSIVDSTYVAGQVGLGTQYDGLKYTKAYFDNLIVNTVGGPQPSPTFFVQDAQNSIDGGVAPVEAGSGEMDAGIADSGDVSDSSEASSPGKNTSGCSCQMGGVSQRGAGPLGLLLLVAAMEGRRAERRAKRAAPREGFVDR
jgi:galactosylceramidase